MKILLDENIFFSCLNVMIKNNGKLYGFSRCALLQMLAGKTKREIVMLLASKQ